MSASPPTVTPMFPLSVVLLPGELLPLQIFEPRYRQMLADCLDQPEDDGEDIDPRSPYTGRGFGVTLIERGQETGGGEDRAPIGTYARIVAHRSRPDGRAVLQSLGTRRFHVAEWLADDPYPRAILEPLPDTSDVEPGPSEYSRIGDDIAALFAMIEATGQTVPAFDEGPSEPDPADHDRAYRWAAQLPLGQADRYDLLSARSPTDRLDVLADAVAGVTAVVRFRLQTD
ncbi:LON peptidase substrate-binding domain-containing protein [Williamsia sterculiae]|uniref:Lon N-terminal domain-containing protein n=1 Tax=Williamsia sterculiae TaxID=1344003 RepID=A0A1N7CSM2_9NOCA|nr:LON peptidase substrate-binding domain-containing protein [Williamsia sterculiae]SIR66656.1 hypothetical protein SAMN05445060_0343 [Williamsia sterculiae]